MERMRTPRNKNYDSENLERAVVQRRTAIENHNLEEKKEAEQAIVQYLDRYIYWALHNYGSLIAREDMDDIRQEIWLRIWARIDGYEADKGTGSTYITRDVMHVISDYINEKQYATNQYYGKILRQIEGIRQECEAHGEPLTPGVVSRELKVAEKKAAEYIEMLNRQIISYDKLNDSGYRWELQCGSAEDDLIRREDTEYIRALMKKSLSEDDYEFICRYLAENPRKKSEFFRRIALEENTEPDKIRSRFGRILRTLKKYIPGTTK